MATTGHRDGDGGAEAILPQSREYGELFDERRQATRFPREDDSDFAVIWQAPGGQLLVAVHDESLSGLGIIVDPAVGLRVGSCVNVLYAGDQLKAEVRHVTTLANGKCLLGLDCQRVER